MTSLTAEENAIKKYLKSFYDEKEAKQKIEEAFEGGITEMEQKNGNISFKSIMINMNFREKSDIQAASIQGKAIGIFTRGLKYKKFWETLFENRLNVKTIMSNLQTKRFNTEFFTATTEHWRASNLREDFNTSNKDYTESMEKMEGIIKLFRKS